MLLQSQFSKLTAEEKKDLPDSSDHVADCNNAVQSLIDHPLNQQMKEDVKILLINAQ